MKRIALMGLLAAGLAVGLYGCGGGADTNGDGGIGSDTQGSGTEDTGNAGGGDATTGGDENHPDGGAVNDGGLDAGKGTMVPVPAGKFHMGCNSAVDDDCYGDENPYHEVTLPAFKIDKYEVTTGEYQKCVDSGGCLVAATFTNCNYGVAGKESHPINCVDWNQATAYCTLAGKRLPTEAEWEKAARGTDGRKYPWGNASLDCDHAVQNATGCSNSGTAAVGSKPKGVSLYGAEDMVGNLFEWVNDWYGDAYYASSPASDPPGPASGNARVGRGGSWSSLDTKDLRASFRSSGDQTVRNYSYGFRCAASGQ